MPVRPDRAQALALALEGVTSYPHFERLAFRTPRRTFATLSRSGTDINFAFDSELQARFCQLAPHAFSPVAGGWGRMGFTRCDLKAIDAATFKQALLAAHARASVPRAKGPLRPAGKKARPARPAKARG